MTQPQSEIIDTALGRARVTHFDSHEEAEAHIKLQQDLLRMDLECFNKVQKIWADYFAPKPAPLQRFLNFIDNKINRYEKGES